MEVPAVRVSTGLGSESRRYFGDGCGWRHNFCLSDATLDGIPKKMRLTLLPLACGDSRMRVNVVASHRLGPPFDPATTVHSDTRFSHPRLILAPAKTTEL